MNIFFFTTAFAPSVGGIERVAEILCGQFVAQGHEVRLATLTPGDDDDQFPYPVVRRPGLGQFRALLRWCNVHVQNNVSLKYAWPLLVSRKLMIYRHGSVYQRDDATLAPLDHVKRFVARHTRGIANSHFAATKLGCVHTILNPYDDATFRTMQPWGDRTGDLVFLGRLVSQKGCDTLLHALGRLRADGLTPGLTIIGDGPERSRLEALAGAHMVAAQVRFAGQLRGTRLADELNRHRISIAPSSYEECFGSVALEALACGCVPVVSCRGGLVDAIGPHGFTFPNGDDAALAARLAEALGNPAAARARLDGVERHLATYHAPAVAARYLEVFADAMGHR